TEGSAFEPLSPLTEGVAFVLAGSNEETGVEDPTGGQLPPELAGGLTGGISLIGQAIIDNSPVAEQDMGFSNAIGSLLGGEVQTTDNEPGAPSDPVEGGAPETPLSPLTDALMANSDPAVFAESLAGVIEDFGSSTPFEAGTEALADALRSGGLPEMDGGTG
ncbi:MAG: hypothetical protein ACK5Q1_06325, partial [Limnobacter sp.]